jgi:hypothetical protein
LTNNPPIFPSLPRLEFPRTPLLAERHEAENRQKLGDGFWMNKCNEYFCINPAGMGIEPSKNCGFTHWYERYGHFSGCFLCFTASEVRSNIVPIFNSFFLNQDIQHVCRNPMEVLWLSHVVPGFASKSSEAVGNSVPALQNGSFLKGKTMVTW